MENNVINLTSERQGPNDKSYGPNDKSYGPNDKSYGPNDKSYGITDQLNHLNQMKSMRDRDFPGGMSEIEGMSGGMRQASQRMPDDSAVKIRPKGHALPGVNYGLDILDDAEKEKGKEPRDGGHGRDPRDGGHGRDPRDSMRESPQMSMGDGMAGAGGDMSMDEQMMAGSIGEDEYSASTPPGRQTPPGISERQSLSGMPGMPSFVDRRATEKIAQFDERNDYEMIRKKKIDYVSNFRRLKSQGYVPEGHKDITMASTLAEMEEVVQHLTDQRDLDNAIQLQRKFLIGFAGITEYLCETDLNVIDLNLKGWSLNVTDNISQYDGVFEKLYYKYKDRIDIPPELELLGLVSASAYMFHISRDSFERDSAKLPEMNEIMQRDPELRRRYQAHMAQIARERPQAQMPQQGQMQQQRQMPQRQQPPPQRQMPQQPPPQRQPRQSRRPAPAPEPQQRPSRNRPPQQEARPSGRRPTRHDIPVQGRSRIPMNDPDDVDGLLQSLNSGGEEGSEQEIDLSEIERFSDLA